MRKGEDQMRHLQHPMGFGDKFCAYDIINIYNIYEGQTLQMSGWSRIMFTSIEGALKIWIFEAFFVKIFWSGALHYFCWSVVQKFQIFQCRIE